MLLNLICRNNYGDTWESTIIIVLGLNHITRFFLYAVWNKICGEQKKETEDDLTHIQNLSDRLLLRKILNLIEENQTNWEKQAN